MTQIKIGRPRENCTVACVLDQSKRVGIDRRFAETGVHPGLSYGWRYGVRVWVARRRGQAADSSERGSSSLMLLAACVGRRSGRSITSLSSSVRRAVVPVSGPGAPAYDHSGAAAGGWIRQPACKGYLSLGSKGGASAAVICTLSGSAKLDAWSRFAASQPGSCSRVHRRATPHPGRRTAEFGTANRPKLARLPA